MKKSKTLVITMFVLAAFGGIAAGIWYGVGFFVRAAAARESPADSVLLFCFALLLSALGIASTIRWAKRREGEHRLGDLRLPLYEALIVAWRGVLRAGHEPHGRTATPLPEDIRNLENLLALRGSPAVLEQYNMLCQMAGRPSATPEQVQEQFVRLVTEMRRDVGVHSSISNETNVLDALLRNQPALSRQQPELNPSSADCLPPVQLAGRPAFSLGKSR